MTDQLPPEGWHPDGSGRTRWWDGTMWTDKYQDPVEAEESPTTAQQPAGAKLSGATDPKPQPFYRKKWFVGVVAGIVGLIVGAAAATGTSVEDSPEYKSVASDLKDAKTELGPLKEKVALIDDREKALDERQATVDAAEKSVKSKSDAVAKREKAVGIVEKDILSNTIEGDGIYAVGEDIKAGTYKTKGGVDCYYAVLRDTKGGLNSIVSNNNISGAGIVSVSKGQYLELSGCSEWVRQ